MLLLDKMGTHVLRGPDSELNSDLPKTGIGGLLVDKTVPGVRGFLFVGDDAVVVVNFVKDLLERVVFGFLV